MLNQIEQRNAYNLHKLHAKVCGSLHKAIHYYEAGQPGNFMMELSGTFLPAVKEIIEVYRHARNEINRRDWE